jgi:N-acetylglutamate synthase
MVTNLKKMEYKILPMGMGDYDAVYALWKQCDGIGLSSVDEREGIERYLQRNPEMSFVAKDKDRVVGVILAGHDGRRGMIWHLAVRADYRRQGIGGSLVSRSVEALRSVGIERILIVTFSDNTEGHDFWEANGFCKREYVKLMARDLA